MSEQIEFVPVEVERGYLGMMSFHLVEDEVVWIRFDVLGYPITRSECICQLATFVVYYVATTYYIC